MNVKFSWVKIVKIKIQYSILDSKSQKVIAYLKRDWPTFRAAAGVIIRAINELYIYFRTQSSQNKMVALQLMLNFRS